MGVKLKATNLNLTIDQPQAHLTNDVSSGVSALTVDNIEGFSIGQYIIIGNFGDANAEIIRVHPSTAPSGTTITLSSATLYPHTYDTPITVIDSNQIEFSRSTTLTGSKSVLATVDITADTLETVYNDLTNSSGFWFFRYYNSSTTTFSDYSIGVNYTGFSKKSVYEIFKAARALAGVQKDNEKATDELLFIDLNNCQNDITQSDDWAFELFTDLTSISSELNKNKYSLSGLSVELKYPDTPQGIINLRLGNKLLEPKDIDEIDQDLENTIYTEVATQALVGATSLELDDVSELQDSGSLVAGSNTISYTGRNTSTNTLTGIPSSGVGSITTQLEVDDPVWQGVTSGLPKYYTIYNGDIIFERPVSATYAGQKIKIKGFKDLDQLSDLASEVEIYFYNILRYYIAAQIQYRRGNDSDGDRYMLLFNNNLERNRKRFKVQTQDTRSYWNWDNGRSGITKTDIYSEL